MILNALEGKALPVYGDGKNVRDWLYVRDHCEAIGQVLAKGRPGEVYNVGGKNEIRNIDVVTTICRKLDELRPRAAGPHEQLVTFVADRPGHDRRYAIDPRKIERELGWRPAESFDSGIDKTVRWYLDNAAGDTAVEKAGAEAALAGMVKAAGAAVLAAEAAALGAWMGQYSTHYVFDGSGRAPRDEEATTAPLSVYGRTKLEGEQAVL